MANNSDEILVKFRADATEILNEVKKVEASVKKMHDEFEKGGKSIPRTTQKISSSFNSLGNSINQLSRELPAFTYSAQTGFLALSNNIPMLADQITNLKTKNLELVASGQKAIPVWKSLSAAILSFQTALSFGVTLLTIYGGEIVSWIGSLFKGEEQLKETNEALEKFNETVTKANSLVKVSKSSLLTGLFSVDVAKKNASEAQALIDQITTAEQNALKKNADRVGELEITRRKADEAKKRGDLSNFKFFSQVLDNQQRKLESVLSKELGMSKEKRDALLLELKQIVANGEATEKTSKAKARSTQKEIKELGAYEKLVKEIGDLQTEILNDITTGVGIQENDNRLLADKKRLLDLINEENEKMLFLMQDVQKLESKGLGTVDDKTIKLKDLGKEDKKLDDLEKLAAEEKKARQDSYYNSAISISNSLLETANNLTQTEIDNQEMIRDSKIKSLDDQLERGTINEKKYQSEKTKAEKKADQEISNLRMQQQQREKAIASFQAILKGGLATLQAFIELGPIAGALVGLSVAAEVAAIQSQPLPKFEKGGLIQGKSHRQGGVIIEAEGNEFIVNKLQTPKHMDVLEHINKGSFEEYNKRRYIIPALKKERENIRQSIINSFNDANLLSSDQKNREILREIRDALKEGRPYTNKRKI